MGTQRPSPSLAMMEELKDPSMAHSLPSQGKDSPTLQGKERREIRGPSPSALDAMEASALQTPPWRLTPPPPAPHATR